MKRPPERIKIGAPVVQTALMGYYLGIDGGGTKTCCAIGSEGIEVARAVGPGCRLARVGEARAREALRNTILKACRSAGIEPAQIDCTVIGTTGAGRRDIADRVRQLVADIVPGEVRVVGDMVIAREAAFAGIPGVVVIAGTGSIAYGVNEHGDTARAGGWGPGVSDEGSGEWIGRAAVRAALRSIDERHATVLLAAVQSTWHVSSPDEIASQLKSDDDQAFSTFFPVVLDAAVSGDAVALGILTEAGTELARLARVVMHRLWAPHEGVRVAICGGVFENANLVRQVFTNLLLADRPGTAVLGSPVDPVAGALYLARRPVMRPAGADGA